MQTFQLTIIGIGMIKWFKLQWSTAILGICNSIEIQCDTIAAVAVLVRRLTTNYLFFGEFFQTG